MRRVLCAILTVALFQTISLSCGDDAEPDNPYSFGDPSANQPEEEDSEAADEAKCNAVQETLIACYDGGCESSDSSFCQCWNEGLDLDIESCTCGTLNLGVVCVIYNLDNFSTETFDCDSAMNVLNAQCPP